MIRKFHMAMFCLALISLLAMAVMGNAAEIRSPKTTAVRPAAFTICTACHSTERGKTISGPSLASVAGRKAGSLPGYTYSEALKASGLTWDEAALDRWLASPQKTVPGTKMPFAGIPDPAVRKDVVRYMMTLR